MTANSLDPVIHAPARLRIVATLAALPAEASLSFTRLQDMLELTPGNLITHLRELEDASYVTSEKTGNGTASRTALTRVRERSRLDPANRILASRTLLPVVRGGQRYPSREGEPYVRHLLRVMPAVVGFRIQAVAVLHDILEDTEMSVEGLRETGLHDDVVDAVIALTRRPGQTYDEYVEQVAGNAIAPQVKLADLMDNLANNRRLATSPDVVARIERYERAICRLKARR